MDWNCQHWTPRPLTLLRDKDERSATVVLRYIDDMRRVLARIRRVLKPSGRCCLIVGDSTLREIYLPVHEWIVHVAERAGFRLIEHETDSIRDRRVPPQRVGHSSLIDCEHLLFFEHDG